MTVDQGQVIVQAGVDRPQAGFRVAALVVAVEQAHQIGDGRHKVHADGAKEVGRAANRLELGGKLLDAAGDVALGAIGDRHIEQVDAAEAAMGEKIPLPVGESVPVTEHLGAVRPAPDKVEAALLVQEQVGAGAGPGEAPA